jgi:F-type H+-transporting ATPase subunit epsilon
MPLALEIVTAERIAYNDEVDMVIAPGSEGELGILPRHASLFTLLNPGELRIRKGDQEISLAVSGGFLEVHNDKVSILADTAERAEEIDVKRAEEALARARSLVHEKRGTDDLRFAEAALRRSAIRLKVARRRRGESPGPQV